MSNFFYKFDEFGKCQIKRFKRLQKNLSRDYFHEINRSSKCTLPP